MIFAFAVVVRLLVVAWRTDAADVEMILHADQSEYLTLAQNIRFHGVFSYGAPHRWGTVGMLDSLGPFLPTATRAPLYPLFIALFWWGQTPPGLQVRIAQTILGGGVALLVYLAARPTFGRRSAVIASLSMASAPHTCALTASLLSESLFNFLAMLALWLWGKERPILSGLVTGLATLTRPIMLPLIAALALAAVVFRFKRSAHAKAALAAILVLAPWTVRNAVELHAFVPVATSGWGANLFLGTYDVPYTSGNVWLFFAKDKELADIVQSTTTADSAEQRMMLAAVERIQEAPLRWVYVRLKQYPRLFISSGYYLVPAVPVSPNVLRLVYPLSTIAFLVLAVWGMFLARRSWRSVYMLAAFPIMLAAVQLPGLVEERYSTPMVPMLLIFVGYAVSRLWSGKP